MHQHTRVCTACEGLQHGGSGGQRRRTRWQRGRRRGRGQRQSYLDIERRGRHLARVQGWHAWLHDMRGGHTGLAYLAGILGWHTGQEQRRWSIRPGAAHVARIEVEGEHRQAADRPTAESCHRAEETSLSWQLRRRVCTRGGTQGAAVTSGNAPWVGREQLWRRRRRQQWRR